jgi:Chemotaxis signal transduction protein
MPVAQTNTDPRKSKLAGQLATFYVDDHLFGVNVLSVQEVLRFQHMTPVPRSADVIEGLINLRGQIVTALDMRKRLRLPPRKDNVTPMNVVIRSTEGAVSLLVDEIGDVLQVEEANYEHPPDNLDHDTRSIVKSVYKLKDRLLLVLDEERTVDLVTDKSN